MKQQIKLLLTAFGFFTRIPVPIETAFSQELLNQCNRYFPVVGYVVGGLSALVFLVASEVMPDSLAVLLSMAASILITGAFHEDGFADVCDAFGGGWSKEKILLIMKDSRIGAYGAFGILLLLLTKFESIHSIPSKHIALSIITAHVISRFMAVWTMHTLNYVREDNSSKSKPITKELEHKDLVLALLISLPSAFLLWDIQLLWLILPLLLTKFLMERYFKKWIGGYTGDCLGSIQQLSEVVVYITIVAITYSEPAFKIFH